VPLRLRLTIVYVVLLAGALVGLSLSVYLVTSNRISESVNEKLRLQGDAVITALNPIDPPLSAETMRANQWLRLEEEAASGIIFQLRSLDGRVLYSSFPPGSPDLPLLATGNPPESFFATTDIREERFRLQYQPIRQDDQVLGGMVTGQSLKDTDEALNQVRTTLVFGGVAVLLITNVPAYMLAGRVLQPVRRVSRLARDIERTADFSRRVPLSAAGDEMAELTATFNSMIKRVERTLEAQKAFLADSSHELRRPLTVLRTNIAILHDPSLPAEEREVCLREMRAEAEAMSRLLSDLLLLSRRRRDEIVRAPVDLSAICEQTVARLRARDSDHKLVAEIVAGAQVRGDEKRLRQMLENLLENSVDYTPVGGRIELNVRLVDGLARLEVRDTGIGISNQDLPHIFDRFYRGQDARATRSEGTGLGLAIVKYIVDAHSGSIEVTSQPGRGTTFVVDLPLAAQSGS
jgi:two-component system OmpR family sensor kinase